MKVLEVRERERERESIRETRYLGNTRIIEYDQRLKIHNMMTEICDGCSLSARLIGEKGPNNNRFEMEESGT